ncbi:MAG: glycoside hydrolase [Planctomycetia bacterium]|nr:glycoside hydrolase [Planctomycetia bacterium]
MSTVLSRQTLRAVMAISLITASFLIHVAPYAHADDATPASVWTLPEDPPTWARDSSALHVERVTQTAVESQSPRVGIRLRHEASTDWAVRIPTRVAVEPGQVFSLSALVENQGQTQCATGVILYGADNHALDWNFGGVEIFKGDAAQRVQSRFVVPRGCVEIEPRIIGSGNTDVTIWELTLAQEDSLPLLAPTEERYVLENAYLRCEFNPNDASFSLLDKTAARLWRQDVTAASQFVLNCRADSRRVDAELLDGRTLLRYHALIDLEPDAPEILITLTAPKDDAQTQPVAYPYPFKTQENERVILPVNEGVAFATTENNIGVETIHTFGGHGLCMSFWGVERNLPNPQESYALLGIIETPDDSDVVVKRYANASDRPDAPPTLAIAQRWHGAMRKFAYDKKLRLVLCPKGGYVAMCKRYRQYAQQIGRLVTFEEKARQNPERAQALDRLIGAVNVWAWSDLDYNRRDPVKTIQRLKELGIERILWSGGGSAEQIDAMNKIEGVLTCRYDIYQDVMNPEQYDKISYVHGDWIPEAWPDQINWDSPDGRWTRGWTVDQKDTTQPRIPCGVLCDAFACQYAQKRIAEELKTKRYRARFLDTTVASPWRECWNPEHPLTRTDSKNARMELLALICNRFNLVCGSETGIDVSVPYCDFYEGMMSLGPYRIEDAGHYPGRIVDDPPEQVKRVQVGYQYRLPLFELVYHDCVVSYWYWGDNSNKFPSLWRDRDLFNALYGTPPMFCFTEDFFQDNSERFAQSYRVAQPVARATGRVEMTEHACLTEDRAVQRTRFANGTTVYVNFGAQPETIESDKLTLPARSATVQDKDGNVKTLQ